MKKSSLVFSSMMTYFVLMTCFVLVRIFFIYVELPFSSQINDLISTIFVQVGLMFFMSIFIFSFLRKQKAKITLEEFGFKKLSLLPIIICFLIGILCYVLNTFVASFFSNIISFLGYEKSPSFSVLSSSTDYSIVAFLLQVLSISILPAICEEVAHRGLLLRGLSTLGLMQALIISSILFGLMHLNVNQFFFATVLGFMIGLTAVISKNIFPAIIIHFTNNFLSVYLVFAYMNGWIGGNFTTLFERFLYGNGSILSFFLSSVLVLGIIMLGLIVLFVWLLKETRIKKVKKMLSDIAEINKEYSSSPENFNQDQNFMNINNLNKLMGKYNIKGLNSMVFTEVENKKQKPTASEVVLIVATFLVGGFITLFTFIWGIL
ncbi:MAG: CPBP family intramembrane metalloprotease [Clostridia bacterium]|nr:CPBP family intramembrane metalloprotease [Clostridia bacterium]